MRADIYYNSTNSIFNIKYSMSFSQEQLITAIENKNGKYRLDDITLTTPTGIYKGIGSLDCKDALELSITFLPSTQIPLIPQGGIVLRKDFWKLTGVIEHSLNIEIKSLAPSHSQQADLMKGIHTFFFKVNELDVVPSGTDLKTSDEIIEMIEKAYPAQKPKESRKATLEKTNPKISFFAILKTYELIAHDKGTRIVETNDFLGEKSSSTLDTFIGTLPGWKYGLIQIKSDLHIHMRSDDQCNLQDMETARKHFDAFLKSIAFTHGKHAWPSQIEHRRDHKLLLNKIRIIGNVSRTPHAPFSKRIAFNGQSGQISWNLSDPLQKAYNFFLSESELSKDIDNLLYLFRAAGDGILDVELLTLCALYESLMRSIYAHMQREKKSASNLAFTKAKKLVLEDIKVRDNAGQGLEGAAFKRISSILVNASYEHISEIADAVTKSLAVNVFDWKQIHSTWKTYRNPLSHRIGSGTDDLPKQLIAISQLSGAINCIILKIMGYSGIMQSSTFEEGFKNI